MGHTVVLAVCMNSSVSLDTLPRGWSVWFMVNAIGQRVLARYQHCTEYALRSGAVESGYTVCPRLEHMNQLEFWFDWDTLLW